MFEFLKRKKNESNDIKLCSPLAGEAVDIISVPDPTFSEKMLGEGIAIIPTEGEIVAPIEGTISMVFDTKHAVSITSKEGVEILIHVGLDTVTLNGNGFETFVEVGDNVKVGDLLLKVDLDIVKEAGLNTITSMVVCNTDEYDAVEVCKFDDVAVGDEVVSIVTSK